ncbi:MAG: transcription antitermination factor NusB, partial [Parvularculaceae bacterium]
MQDAPARGRRAAAPDKDPPEDPGLASRRAARDVLRLVAGERTLDDALDEARSFAALEGPDRAFARLLATTVLRRRGAIDHVLGAYIDRPLPKRARRAMDILRAAAAQSLFLETPAHAAVSTAVALCKENRETAGYAGMANAVARRVAAAGPAAVGRWREGGGAGLQRVGGSGVGAGG